MSKCALIASAFSLLTLTRSHSTPHLCASAAEATACRVPHPLSAKNSSGGSSDTVRQRQVPQSTSSRKRTVGEFPYVGVLTDSWSSLLGSGVSH